MTTTTAAGPQHVAGEIPTAIVFRRAATSELTRLLTLRSTWWTLFAGTGLMVFIGAVMAFEHSGADPAPVWLAAQTAAVPGQFAFLLLVLLAITGEYSTGAIRSSLQWVPRRGVLFAARMLAAVSFATACAVIAAAATVLVAWILLGQAAEVVPGDIVVSLARIALAIAFGGVVAAGLGLLLRSTAGTLTSIFLLMFVLVVALGNSGVSWLVAISDHLPGRAVVGILVVDELSADTIATVMITWSAAAILAGGWSLLRRDAV